MLEVTLRDIIDDKGVSIAKYDRHHVNDRLMICYKVGERERSGFDFYVVENGGWVCPKPRDIAEYYYDVLFSGSVYWDGLRHMWMGDKQTDNENYLYCANTNDLSIIFAELSKLECKHCKEVV